MSDVLPLQVLERVEQRARRHEVDASMALALNDCALLADVALAGQPRSAPGAGALPSWSVPCRSPAMSLWNLSALTAIRS